jgi:hypothetical protein
MLTWWNDSGLRRDHAEVANAVWPQAQEHVAFAIAVVLEVRVQLERVGAAEVIDLHRVIDHQLHGLQRVHLSRDRRRAR